MADVVALSPTMPHHNSLAAADAFLDHADVAATACRWPRWSTASAQLEPWPT
jgi:hypothetical protein